MSYLLDTNICVHYLRNKFDIAKKLNEIGFENLSLSEITVFELCFGAEKSENPAKTYQGVDNLIKSLNIIPIRTLITENIKDFKNIRNLKTDNWIQR